MYYGKALDMELKPVVASNEAITRSRNVLALLGSCADTTPPTVFRPQHWPDKPGGLNFGPPYGYRLQELPPDTVSWTFAYDVSGISRVSFYYRIDKDNENPLFDHRNEVFAQGEGVGPWQIVPMTRRVFPKENITNDPEIDTSIMPLEIADLFYVRLSGLWDCLIDWFVEAIDTKANRARTHIQHLYIGSGGETAKVWTPSYPDCDDTTTITHNKASSLHRGINGWQTAPPSLWPEGTTAFGGGKSVGTPMESCGEVVFCVTVGPFWDIASQVDFVFHHDDGTWDNDNGKDWHIPIAPCVADDETWIEEEAKEVIDQGSLIEVIDLCETQDAFVVLDRFFFEEQDLDLGDGDGTFEDSDSNRAWDEDIWQDAPHAVTSSGGGCRALDKSTGRAVEVPVLFALLFGLIMGLQVCKKE
jgi:hypothetical protein